MDRVELAWEAAKAVLEGGGNSHETVEVMQRLLTQVWVGFASRFGEQNADDFIHAACLDIRDNAMSEGRKIRNKTLS